MLGFRPAGVTSTPRASAQWGGGQPPHTWTSIHSQAQKDGKGEVDDCSSRTSGPTSASTNSWGRCDMKQNGAPYFSRPVTLCGGEQAIRKRRRSRRRKPTLSTRPPEHGGRPIKPRTLTRLTSRLRWVRTLICRTDRSLACRRRTGATSPGAFCARPAHATGRRSVECRAGSLRPLRQSKLPALAAADRRSLSSRSRGRCR
jgi:hypothetical protein